MAPLNPWFVREFKSLQNQHGPRLMQELGKPNKKVQLITVSAITNVDDEEVMWAILSDTEYQIDCYVSNQVVKEYNEGTAVSFTASSTQRDIFILLSWRFVLAQPVDATKHRQAMARISNNSNNKNVTRPNPPLLSPRICIRIDKLERYGDGGGVEIHVPGQRSFLQFYKEATVASFIRARLGQDEPAQEVVYESDLPKAAPKPIKKSIVVPTAQQINFHKHRQSTTTAVPSISTSSTTTTTTISRPRPSTSTNNAIDKNENQDLNDWPLEWDRSSIIHNPSSSTVPNQSHEIERQERWRLQKWKRVEKALRDRKVKVDPVVKKWFEGFEKDEKGNLREKEKVGLDEKEKGKGKEVVGKEDSSNTKMASASKHQKSEKSDSTSTPTLPHLRQHNPDPPPPTLTKPRTRERLSETSNSFENQYGSKRGSVPQDVVPFKTVERRRQSSGAMKESGNEENQQVQRNASRDVQEKQKKERLADREDVDMSSSDDEVLRSLVPNSQASSTGRIRPPKLPSHSSRPSTRAPINPCVSHGPNQSRPPTSTSRVPSTPSNFVVPPHSSGAISQTLPRSTESTIRRVPRASLSSSSKKEANSPAAPTPSSTSRRRIPRASLPSSSSSLSSSRRSPIPSTGESSSTRPLSQINADPSQQQRQVSSQQQQQTSFPNPTMNSTSSSSFPSPTLPKTHQQPLLPHTPSFPTASAYDNVFNNGIDSTLEEEESVDLELIEREFPRGGQQEVVSQKGGIGEGGKMDVDRKEEEDEDDEEEERSWQEETRERERIQLEEMERERKKEEEEEERLRKIEEERERIEQERIAKEEERKVIEEKKRKAIQRKREREEERKRKELEEKEMRRRREAEREAQEKKVKEEPERVQAEEKKEREREVRRQEEKAKEQRRMGREEARRRDLAVAVEQERVAEERKLAKEEEKKKAVMERNVGTTRMSHADQTQHSQRPAASTTMHTVLDSIQKETKKRPRESPVSTLKLSQQVVPNSPVSPDEQRLAKKARRASPSSSPSALHRVSNIVVPRDASTSNVEVPKLSFVFKKRLPLGTVATQEDRQDRKKQLQMQAQLLLKAREKMSMK